MTASILGWSTLRAAVAGLLLAGPALAQPVAGAPAVTGSPSFAADDRDGDGFISRDEAQANPALADEFNALDSARRGKLAREQLAGWLLH